MRVRPFVLCVVLAGAALGAAGCSSSGPSSPGAPSSSGASSSGAGAPSSSAGASSSGAGASSSGAGASSSGAGASSSGAGGPSSGKAPAGKPGGTVTVRSGGKVVCVITLDKNGTGTCKVSTADYKAGKVTFTGTYNGGSQFKTANGSTTLTLQPAKQAA